MEKLPCKIQLMDPYFKNVTMIRLEIVVPYIGLSQNWSSAKVEMTCDQIVFDIKLFICFGGNFPSNSSDIRFINPDIQGWFEHTMIIF